MKISELILKLIWVCNGHRITKTILKNNKVGVKALSDFKTYYKATVIKMD